MISIERIEGHILLIRGQKVILDSELAEIYGVTTTRLNQQVRRNISRFPSDFAFLLTQEESTNLMLQIATSRLAWGGRRKPPMVFTEHGAVMAACVLNTPVAVAASILVVKAFVRLRKILSSNTEMLLRLDALERKFVEYDQRLSEVFDAIRQLMTPHEPEAKGKIGFRLD